MLNKDNILFLFKHPLHIPAQLKFKLYQLKNPEAPWITPAAVEFLDKLITNNFRIFEWGSGRSTVWLTKRAKEVISVEDNHDWFNKVGQTIKTHGLKNIQYHLIPLQEDHDSIDQIDAIEKKMIPNYVAIIDQEQSSSLDLVIVDGRFRHICVSRALDKIKPNGYLMIDNSNWVNLKSWGVPINWPIVHDSDIKVSRTTIWQKPANS